MRPPSSPIQSYAPEPSLKGRGDRRRRTLPAKVTTRRPFDKLRDHRRLSPTL